VKEIAASGLLRDLIARHRVDGLVEVGSRK